MKEVNFEYSIGSDVDYEDLVVDIGFDNQLVALLTQEDGFENLRIQLYPPNDASYWDFRLDELEAIIQKAKQRLWDLRKLPEDPS
jgi:hypothetical protein